LLWTLKFRRLYLVGNKEENMDEYSIMIEKHRAVYSVITYNM